ncbi:MAG TPA: photosynthetic reaction center cytochrome c subunit family protein [Bryobacteraceae bacterium]|nr:photosynthetic reaction center cytochrome c subunit family protein [Bryobacteraceae bacterium]
MTGVWKADLEKSKLAGPPGPPPTNYLVIIERKMAMFDSHTKEQAPQFVETTGIWGQHGQERSVLTVFLNSKAAILPYAGVPTRLIASSDGGVFVVSGETAGRPNTLKRTYALSPDGQTLTLHSLTSNNGKEAESTIVLLKQPDAAAAPLRAPEESAEKRFKNVKTPLKNLPASEFVETMRYFAWSLGKNCEFCHVQHKMDLDDKKEKKTARKMIEMTASIDAEHFKNHPAVRCFTCHEGHEHPLTHPLFPDEAAAAAAAAQAPQSPGH